MSLGTRHANSSGPEVKMALVAIDRANGNLLDLAACLDRIQRQRRYYDSLRVGMVGEHCREKLERIATVALVHEDIWHRIAFEFARSRRPRPPTCMTLDLADLLIGWKPSRSVAGALTLIFNIAKSLACNLAPNLFSPYVICILPIPPHHKKDMPRSSGGLTRPTASGLAVHKDRFRFINLKV